MKVYQDLLEDILASGERKENRTGIDTICTFARTLRFDVSKGFPIVTTKKVYWPGVVHELLWFIAGDTNVKYLQDNKVRIWNEWCNEDGELGPVYGKQWRAFPAGQRWVGDNDHAPEDSGMVNVYVDQLQNVIDKLRTNPNDRRLIVSAWNPAVLPDDNASFAENVANGKQALPPCHYSFQFVHINGTLNMIFNMRSIDTFLGLPFNIASYALLLSMVAHVTDLKVGELVWSGADVHIYDNHMEQIKEQLSRQPLGLPVLGLNPDIKEIDDFTADDIQLIGYNHHPAIAAKVAV